MIKNKIVQWVLSTWIIQLLMRLIFKGWCFIRKDGNRFKFSEALSYQGDPNVAPKHRPSNWDTWVCIKVPSAWSTSQVYVMFDIHTGQRFAFLRKYFMAEQYIAFKVGHEGAQVLFGSLCTNFPPPPAPRFIGRWTGSKDDLPAEMKQLRFTSDHITYI